MERYAPEMARLLSPSCLLIEFGSGSSAKTRRLLDCLPDLAGYVPIDVSAEFLLRSAQALAQDYPRLRVVPVCADFTSLGELPQNWDRAIQRIVYFPGSTIGNFGPDESIAVLRRAATLCGLGGGLLLGADLRKDHRVLEAAYNDARGVTAAFNRNILIRINRELNGEFDVKQFDHRAFFNAEAGRIEMHLVSRRDQRTRVGETAFFFTPANRSGPSIRTNTLFRK